jgi:trehalose-6-phosphate synthase
MKAFSSGNCKEMLLVTSFAKQCPHLRGQLIRDPVRSSEDWDFMNKALHQKAKEKRNKTILRT